MGRVPNLYYFLSIFNKKVSADNVHQKSHGYFFPECSSPSLFVISDQLIVME
jgi:hypothetical protein